MRTSEKLKASYTYTLDEEVTSEEIERFSSYWEANRDPIAREALKILVQGLEIFSDQLAEFSDQLARLASRIETILK